MPVQKTNPLRFECIPHIDRVIIVSSKEQAATNAEIYLVNTKNDAFLAVDGHLFIGTTIKQTHCTVIRTASNGVTTWMEFDAVNVRCVTFKALNYMTRALKNKNIELIKIEAN